MKPYEKIDEYYTVHPFALPDGGIGHMSDIVSWRDRGALRYEQEVRLIQTCLGVSPDGIIGPDTRRAALKAYEQRNRGAL